MILEKISVECEDVCHNCSGFIGKGDTIYYFDNQNCQCSACKKETYDIFDDIFDIYMMNCLFVVEVVQKDIFIKVCIKLQKN